MDIENLHKYVSLTKTPTGAVCSIAGIPALTVYESREGYSWSIDPGFARLTYGASSYADVPYNLETYETVEEAVADCLSRLHDAGVMNVEVDLPQDSYEQAYAEILDECMTTAKSLSGLSIMDRVDLGHEMYADIIGEARGSVSKHSITDLIDHAKNNVANGKKPYHGLENSAAAVLIRAMNKAKAGIPHPHSEHDEHLKELGGVKVEKGRPKGSTVAAKAAEKETAEKEKKQSRASLGVWGGLGKL